MAEGTHIARNRGAVLGSTRVGVLGGLAVALVVLVAAAALIGAYPLSPGDIAQALARRLAGAPPLGQIDTVLFEVRLPSVFAAVLVGAAMAAAGAAYQTLFRNPLVSPDILGRLDRSRPRRRDRHFSVAAGRRHPAAAFMIGLATVGLVYAIAAVVHGREPMLVLVLAGVVVGSLAGAVISLLKILADPYDQLPAIVFWLLGSLSAIRKGEVWTAAPLVVLGLFPSFFCAGASMCFRWETRRRRRSAWRPADSLVRHRRGDADDGERRCHLRRDRLGGPGHSAHRPDDRRPQLRPTAADRHAAGCQLPALRGHVGAHHGPHRGADRHSYRRRRRAVLPVAAGAGREGWS